MLKQIFIFGTITTLLSAAFAGDLPDASSLGARGVSAGLDLNVELAMEMDREFADILPRATSTNFQTFTGLLGGTPPDPITASSDPSRPFSVGSETFTKLADAVQRSCSNQNQACSKAANAAGGGGGGGGKTTDANALTVENCTTQNKACSDSTKGLAAKTLNEAASAGDVLVFC